MSRIYLARGRIPLQGGFLFRAVQTLSMGMTKADLAKKHSSLKRKLEELEEDYSGSEKELKDLKPLKVLSENEYHELSLKYGHVFEAKIGAEAIVELLEKIDIFVVDVLDIILTQNIVCHGCC